MTISLPHNVPEAASCIGCPPQDTEQRFYDMFPDWWSSQTACLRPEEELALIGSFAPSIAERINGKVDPADKFPRHRSEGPLVRKCPAEDHSHGWHIKACFGYVNINLYGYGAQSPGYGHLAPTVLGREVYRNLKQSGETFDFVLQMMEHQSEQAALHRQAEQIVTNLPASKVSSGFEEGRVKDEYEKLRCGE